MFSILYVDDEPGLLEIGKLFLEQGGQFTVDTLTSADEALEVLRTRQYDAIISDYQMPVINGIEFLKHVRASGSTLPFIIFTGRGREEIVIQALNEGADFYLQKGGEPVSQFAELGHKVQAAILQRRAEESIRDHERREADIINFLPDATFAIDTQGVVIAWNRAMERMTGVSASDVLGKGDYEYALPFYHERRPILINLVLDDDPAIAGKYPFLKKEGKTLFSQIPIPHFNDGKGAMLWFTASPLYDTKGTIVGAIESIREITEWKRTEEALYESERRFRELADMLPLAIYEADAQMSLVYANRRAFEIFGYSSNAIRNGENVMNMIAPEDRDRAAAAVQTLLNGGSHAESIEYTALRKDGSTFPVSIYSSLVFRDGTPSGIRGIIIDITDRKRAEERVSESEQNYRFLFENATEGILVAQGDRMVHVNPALIRILDRPAELIMSRPFTDFIHPDDREMVMSRHLRRMRGEVPFTGYMFRIITGKGEEKWVLINSTVISWSGKPASLSFLTDMTDRKLAEDNLLGASREYAHLLDQIQDVYYRTDSEGRLIRASRSWATLLGYDNVSECLGRDIASDFYLDPKDRKRFLEAIACNGKVTDYEVVLKKKDGTPVLVSTSSHTNVDAKGTVVGVEGTFHDITGRKEQERILRTQRDLGIALQTAHGMNETLGICLNAAIEISGMDSGGIYLVDQQTGSADLVNFRNLTEEFIASVSHVPAGSVNAGIVMAGKPVYIPFSNIRKYNTEVQDTEGLKAVTILPILSGGRSIACLNLSSHTLGEIPVTARVALETIANQIGTAVERIRADEALAESEQRYRNIIEDQTEFICRFGPDGTHVFVNEAYCRYFGLAREDIIGHRFRPDIPPEDKKHMNEFFASLTQDHPVDIITHRIIMPDGKIRWQRWSDRAIFDPSGKITEYQSVGRDVTEMKETEQALIESEARYRSLSEASQDLIFVIDKNDRVVYVNNSAAAMFGLPVDRIVGMERMRLFPPGVAEGQMKAIQKVLTTGDGFRSTGKLTFGGQELWFDHSLMPIRDASGTITQVLGISRDITEQKNTEEMLRRQTGDLDSRNRLISTLLDTIPIGIFMVEAPSGKPIIANREATRLLGRGILPDATEDNLADVYEAYKADSCKRYPTQEMPIVRGMYGDSHNIDDMVVVRPDGTKVHLEVFGTPIIDSQGSVIASLVSFMDITERKRTEQVIREANRKINLLTSITRHDVANQITILRGFTKIAMMKKPGPDIAGLLEKIDAAVSMIAQQIGFTRAYQEFGIHAPGWQRIHDIVAQQQKTEGISLSCTCDAEVFADPLLERVFYNLIDNAVRHGETVTAITVSCRPDPDGLVIRVMDNGIGVSPELKEKIFEKGYGKNTGFGLFLAREILAITGMTIRETGTFRKGAMFEITVPKGSYRFAS